MDIGALVIERKIIGRGEIVADIERNCHAYTCCNAYAKVVYECSCENC